MLRLRSSATAIAFSILMVLLSLSGCAQEIKRYKPNILESLPHDRNAYTQGLFFHDNTLYESCGQYGQSTFRKNDLATGKVVRQLNFDSKYFLEGSCILDGRIYILTWQEHKCFVYDAENWKYLGELPYYTEGWGLTTDGKELIMSDGSATLYFLDPMTFTVRRQVSVTLNGKKIPFINELEYIDGDIWANVYGDDSILIINGSNGKVKGVIDCRHLLPNSLRSSNTDVLNGIAYNPCDKSIWITGKNWPRIFKIEIK